MGGWHWVPIRRWTDAAFLQRSYVLALTTILPIGLHLIVGEPVGLLQLAGAIEAAHIPVVTGLTLYLNHRPLPPDLRPSRLTTVIAGLAGLFFAVFAIVYVVQLFT